MHTEWEVAVIGGGASGLAAAVRAAQLGCRTVILERGERVGRKLLATGNGKCNLTNAQAAQITGHYFGTHPERVEQALAHCPPSETTAFFRAIGLLTRTDAEGRVYPYSEQASAVLDVLRNAAQNAGVREQCGFEVCAIERVRDGFVLHGANGMRTTARAVIAACGGPAAPSNGGTELGATLLRAMGHTIIPQRPSLTPLRTDERLTRPLKGLRVKCAVALQSNGKTVQREHGELQFGDGQLSGICVFQLSRKAGECLQSAQKVTLSVDLLPELSEQETAALLEQRAAQLAQLPAEMYFTGLFAKKIGYELMRLCVKDLSHRTVGTLTAQERAQLAARCRAWAFPVTATGTYAAAQVTAGGARLDQFDMRTMASKCVTGLFACGELLDADGCCGGYNLQWAWSSGLLAARGAAAFCGKKVQV